MVFEVDRRARGLIFDIDGTLVDTMTFHLQAWQEVTKPYKFEFTMPLLQQLAGTTSRDIALYINRHYGYNLDVETVVKAKNDVYLSLSSELKPIEPVFKIVREYYGKLPFALGTGENRDIALKNITAAGLSRYFEIIVTADDIKNAKPDPEIFLKCAELMKVPPEFCQVFEDAPQGLAAAIKAGMIATDVRPFL